MPVDSKKIKHIKHIKLLVKHDLVSETIDVNGKLVDQVFNEFHCTKIEAEQAVDAVMDVLGKDDLPLSQMASTQTGEGDIDSEYLAAFKALIGSYLGAASNSYSAHAKNPREAVIETWKKTKQERLRKLDGSAAYHQSDTIAFPSISEMSLERRADLYDNGGHWLVEKDICAARDRFDLKDRLAVLPLDLEVLTHHLKIRKKEIESGTFTCPCSFYVAFSMTGLSIAGSGTHWIPAQIIVNEPDNVTMRLELGKGAGEAKKKAMVDMLTEAGHKAGFKKVNAIAECLNGQGDAWSCGYRALCRIAKWVKESEKAANDGFNSYVEDFACVPMDDPKQNQELISNQLKQKLIIQVFKEEKKDLFQEKLTVRPRVEPEPKENIRPDRATKKAPSATSTSTNSARTTKKVPVPVVMTQNAVGSVKKGEIGTEPVSFRSTEPESWAKKLAKVIEQHEKSGNYAEVADAIINTRTETGEDNLLKKVLEKQAVFWEKATGGALPVVNIPDPEFSSDDEKLALKIAAEEALEYEKEIERNQSPRLGRR